MDTSNSTLPSLNSVIASIDKQRTFDLLERKAFCERDVDEEECLSLLDYYRGKCLDYNQQPIGMDTRKALQFLNDVRYDISFLHCDESFRVNICTQIREVTAELFGELAANRDAVLADLIEARQVQDVQEASEVTFVYETFSRGNFNRVTVSSKKG